MLHFLERALAEALRVLRLIESPSPPQTSRTCHMLLAPANPPRPIPYRNRPQGGPSGHDTIQTGPRKLQQFQNHTHCFRGGIEPSEIASSTASRRAGRPISSVTVRCYECAPWRGGFFAGLFPLGRRRQRPFGGEHTQTRGIEWGAARKPGNAGYRRERCKVGEVSGRSCSTAVWLLQAAQGQSDGQRHRLSVVQHP